MKNKEHIIIMDSNESSAVFFSIEKPLLKDFVSEKAYGWGGGGNAFLCFLILNYFI